VTAAARFDLAPKQALEFFRGKGYQVGFAWQDVWQQEHDAAFTVAKMMSLDLLRDTRAAVDKALAEGQSFEQFREGIEGRLVQAGWWGKAEMKDPVTGEMKTVQLGSPRRLRTIFRTNLQTAYAAGHWQEIQDTKASAPYLMYDAVDDDRVRDEHAAWDGTILPADDPWWNAHMPPNGWNCRCGVVQLSEAQAKEAGYEPGDKAPPAKLREYTNPRSGEVSMVPEGVDPGWAYNPGASRAGKAVDNLVSKAGDAPADMGAAAMRALSSAEIEAFDQEHVAWFDSTQRTDAGVRSTRRIVGGMATEDLAFLAERGRSPESAAIVLESRLITGAKALRHAAKGDALTAEDWRALPRSLRSAEVVLFDKKTGHLLYVFPAVDDPRKAKVVVHVDRVEKDSRLNSIRTAFKVQRGNLSQAQGFDVVRGELK
jgi:SPP1 gp7 family putative phage head morphogenesis protein